MIVFKDKISDDDLFTDAYKMEDDGVFYRVFGKNVTEKTALNEAAFGANPSAEEAEEQCDTDAVSGCDIVLANRLVETGFSKKDYKTYITKYMKRLKSEITDEEKQQAFMKSMSEAVKKILGRFDDFRFFQGESTDEDAMVVLMDFKEDGVTPILLFFKDGVREEKQ